MFEKNLRLAYLLDFYGNLLDDHTRGVMMAYYDDDLSLAEVADGVGISRQGVRHIVKKGEELLEFYESRLGLAERAASLENIITRLDGVKAKLSIDECDRDELIEEISAITSLLNEEK